MWVRFWKKSGPMQGLSETYRYYQKVSSVIQMDAEKWAEEQPGGHNTSYRYGFEVVDHPPIEWLHKYKSQLIDDSNKLLRKTNIVDDTLKSICKKEGHVVEKTKWDSCLCKVCLEDLGWWCPKNPKHYCEYDDKHGEDCIYCGQPEERK